MNKLFWIALSIVSISGISISGVSISGCNNNHQEETKNPSTENIYITQKLFTNKNGAFNTHSLKIRENQNACYLVDENGKKINEWEQKDKLKIKYCKLLSNGQLIRAVNIENPAFSKHKNTHGLLELVNWDGSVQWSMTYADETHIIYNDIVAIEQGDGSFTFLVHSWDKIYAKNTQDKDNYLLKDILLEIKPLDKNKYDIVCEWTI